jgi:hypothetical protein
MKTALVQSRIDLKIFRRFNPSPTALGRGERDFSVGSRRDARDDSAHRQRLAEPIGVRALVSQKLSGLGHREQHQRRALEVLESLI